MCKKAIWVNSAAKELLEFVGGLIQKNDFSEFCPTCAPSLLPERARAEYWRAEEAARKTYEQALESARIGSRHITDGETAWKYYQQAGAEAWHQRKKALSVAWVDFFKEPENRVKITSKP